jgi:hypothetical protein
MLDAVWQTFGPFLIPATVFALGVVGYFFLYGLLRLRDARQD